MVEATPKLHATRKVDEKNIHELCILICSDRGEMCLQAFFAEGVETRQRLGAGEGFVADFAGEELFLDFALQFGVLLRALPRARHLWAFEWETSAVRERRRRCSIYCC